MADADWVKYKQIRGKPLPEVTALLGGSYRRLSLLKQDFYAAVGLYERVDDPSTVQPQPGAAPQVLLKVYHTDSFWGLPLGGLGRLLCRREVRALKQLAGIEGVPQLLTTFGASGFVREFVPGCNLREFSRTRQVDSAFFPKLATILDAVHGRGVSHNDLSKPENVLVTMDGRPVLIDFQIATWVDPSHNRFRRAVSRAWVEYMQKVDRYHLAKQYSRRRSMDFTAEERAKLQRKGWIVTMHGWVRRPYRALRHVILRNFLMAGPTPSVDGGTVPKPHLGEPATKPTRPEAVEFEPRT
jgi:predicted Ser/Thr protein kinase